MAMNCPHCGAMNATPGAFCEACGKALPSAAPSGPRVVSAETMPQSAMATSLLSDELVKQQKSASNAMLAVAILLAVFGIILAVIMTQAPRGGGAAAARSETM